VQPALDDLGVRLHDGTATLRVWSQNASAIELVIFDETDLDWETAQLARSSARPSVWEITTELLQPGTRYALRVDGAHSPGNTFNPETLLLDPYRRASPGRRLRGMALGRRRRRIRLGRRRRRRRPSTAP
jgi:glycogen operon protein